MQLYHNRCRIVLFIGEIPPILSRVSSNSTKYIKSLAIKKLPSAGCNDKWFDGFEVDLNPELVAIIGNKGKGKSALSDILGLCANAHVDEGDFSFLHRDKFKNPRTNFARGFQATLTWEGGAPEVKNLGDDADLNAPERVKYIRQSFLEKLCTSIDKRIFEEELEKVIFSRMEDHQKQGKGTLKEVLNERKLSFENEILRIKNEISTKNTLIVDLERRNSANFRKSIDEQLVVRNNELTVHIERKPVERTAPQETEASKEQTTNIIGQIERLRQIIITQAQIKSEMNRERIQLQPEAQELIRLKAELSALSEQIAALKTANTHIAEKYELNWDDLVKFEMNLSSIEELILNKEGRITEITTNLNAETEQNPQVLIQRSETEINQLQGMLEGENKEYQQYLTQLQEWEKIKGQIEGEKDKEGTLTYFQEIKTYLENNIGQDLADARQKRKELLDQLLQVKQRISDLYRELYQPVTEFVSDNRNELSDYHVKIDVALELNDFENKFFNYVSNGVAGSFYGTMEGRQMLKKITETRDFNDPAVVSAWLEDILDHLQFDRRDGQPTNLKRELGPQLKGGFKEKEFYDFIFSMDYYEPNYQLKLGEKTLTELSPGERGALLLIFYLLLDKRDIPIIIDQPEENLDNQSVYNILVHFVKKAKHKRQIILVTHNPNLAVVCDAEQIIKMDIAKNALNTVSRIIGGIENPNINKAIVDILEGTRPAFNNRTSKYEVSNN